MCHWRGCQCQPDAVSPSSSSGRGTGEAHSCAGTPVGTGFLGPWATLLPNRGWLLVGSVPGPASGPPLAHGLPPISSRWAAAARLLRHRCLGKHPLQTAQPPLCTPRPCLPFPWQRHRDRRQRLPPMSPACCHSCHTEPDSGAHPGGFVCAVWLFKKACTSPFPRRKNKEASGADVIPQCWADCVSMSAGSWGLCRVKQGEAAWGCASLCRGVRATGRAELPPGCVGVPAPRVLL